MKPIELTVHLARDRKTAIWYVAASEVPGLRLEAESVHELIRQVEEVAPELVDLNFDEIASLRGMARGEESAERPQVTIRPIIDTPLAIAC